MDKCRKLCVGDLNTEVHVQKPMLEEDGQGGYKPTVWVDYFSFWAKIEWTGGGEREQGGKVTAVSSAKLEAAWDARLDETMRLCIDSFILNVRNVDDWMQRHYIMDIKAERGVGT